MRDNGRLFSNCSRAHPCPNIFRTPINKSTNQRNCTAFRMPQDGRQADDILALARFLMRRLPFHAPTCIHPLSFYEPSKNFIQRVPKLKY